VELGAPTKIGQLVAHRSATGLRVARVTRDPGELSIREREVAACLADGLVNKEIADRLDISEHTAKFHVVNVIVRLRARNRTHAAVIFARSQLLGELAGTAG
jgi:DNA-binding CsgD family transcriptional regulator